MKPKECDCHTITMNPNKFGNDVIFALGVSKSSKIEEFDVKEKATIRLSQDQLKWLIEELQACIRE